MTCVSPPRSGGAAALFAAVALDAPMLIHGSMHIPHDVRLLQSRKNEVGTARDGAPNRTDAGSMQLRPVAACTGTVGVNGLWSILASASLTDVQDRLTSAAPAQPLDARPIPSLLKGTPLGNAWDDDTTCFSGQLVSCTGLAAVVTQMASASCMDVRHGARGIRERTDAAPRALLPRYLGTL